MARAAVGKQQQAMAAKAQRQIHIVQYQQVKMPHNLRTRTYQPQ